MLDLAFLDTLVRPLLEFFSTSGLEELMTILAAAALILVGIDFWKQHKRFPSRKTIFILAIFFLADGIDYAVYVMAAAHDSDFFGLLGVIFDTLVAILAIVVMFNVNNANRRDALERDTDITS